MGLHRVAKAILLASWVGMGALSIQGCSKDEEVAPPAPQPVTVYKYYLYVADSAGDQVYGYELDSATGAIKDEITGSPFTAGDEPVFIARHPTLDYLYVVNRTGRTLSVFEIAPKTGKLTELDAPVTSLSGTNPDSVFPHPDGEYLMVLSKSEMIEAFKVNAVTGALTEEDNSVSGFTDPVSTAHHLAFDATGTYMVTANFSDDNVGSFLFDLSQPDLDLRKRTGSPYSGGNGPWWLAVHPTAPYVWVVNSNEDTIHQFTINAEDGFLSDRVTYGTGSNPYRIATDPEGKALLVVNRGSNALSVYTVDSTEGTVQVASPIATSLDPNRLAIHPEGKAVYVLSTTSMYLDIFSLKTSNGSVSPLGTEDLSGYAPEAIEVIRIAQP